jgi:hypothetical protein
LHLPREVLCSNRCSGFGCSNVGVRVTPERKRTGACVSSRHAVPNKPLEGDACKATRASAASLGFMVNMISERHHLLTFPRKRHGAAWAAAFAGCASTPVASRLVSSSSVASSGFAVPAVGRVALFRAQLRSSSRRRLRVASALSTERRVVVRSESPGPAPSQCFQFGGLPNNSLVPTPATEARFVSLGSGAAQLKR